MQGVHSVTENMFTKCPPWLGAEASRRGLDPILCLAGCGCWFIGKMHMVRALVSIKPEALQPASQALGQKQIPHI